MAVWLFKRKRNPMGKIIKYKSRLNVHGGQTKQGVQYWDTFVPVVQWFTVRILLLLSIIKQLNTRSIDFVLAFPQAEINVDVFMRLPFGFESPSDDQLYVLRLKKNIYGLKDASKTFWDKLQTTQLQPKYGFHQSQVDPCLFFRENLVIVTYVDDCLCLAVTIKFLMTSLQSLPRTLHLPTKERLHSISVSI